MDFFNSAVDVLQTLVIALGAGLGIWGGMVSITLCGAYHESVVYLYHAGGVRAHD